MNGDRKTVRHACVIGDPIAHSRSPMIHGYWLKEYGLAGIYDRRLVKADDLPALVEEIRSGRLAGCNVTVPHKEAVARLVDRRTPVADALGAVNTLWSEHGLVWGDNTDVEGFTANLDDQVPGWAVRVRHAVVLGAGGAARGIVYGLRARGVARITVINRSMERARELARAFGDHVGVADWAERGAWLGEADLLVNTTSLGMAGQPPLDIDVGLLPAQAIVADIVYVPLKTPLLARAHERRLATVDGLGMLLHQAVPGFARWFGVRPHVTPRLREILVADIERKA